MTSAYEENRKKNRPDVKGYSVEELVGPNLGERYKNREIGKETIDNIITGLENDWNELDDGVKQNIIGFGNFIGNEYKKLRTVEEQEKFDPSAYITAGTIRSGEFALNTIGKVSDFVIGNPARGIGWLAGLDPRGREALAIGAQLYLGPKALKQATKLKPSNFGITTKIEPYVPPKGIGKVDKKMINITADAVDETFNLNPEIFRRASKIYKANPSIGMKKAIEEAKLLEGFMPSQLITDKTFGSIKKGGLFDPKRNDTNKFLFAVGPNYKSIQGPDADSARMPWATVTGNVAHFDVSNHRIFQVPGMQDKAQAKRYKDWLTTNLINRYKKQQIDPTLDIKRWSSVNNDFIDSQGNTWRLVRANKKTGSGADQEFIPTPLNEIDSRLMKKQNTNMEEKVILHRLLQTEVKDRNRFEKMYPWMRDWISEQTGENYHEHIFGLDETEFWKSGYGKSLGYMNNDVYDVEKGLGNIVFLRDPRFKKMKDAVAEYITPGKKRQVWPGFKVRAGKVKVFTGGPYKGLNAIIGYDANPTSKTYTDLTIYAYNPSPNVNFGVRVATMPNYYSIVFARDSNGKRILSDESAQLFVNQYLDAVLKGNQPKIVALTDLASVLAKQYPYLVKPGTDFELPAPSGLNLDIDYRTAGAYSIKAPDPDPLDLKTFKMDPALQRKFDKNWKKMLIRIKKGRYEQKDFLELLFPEGDGID